MSVPANYLMDDQPMPAMPDAGGEYADEGEAVAGDAMPSLQELLAADNIAEMLTDRELEEIADKCIREYRCDEQSRARWEERMRPAFKLAAQVMEEKQHPWPGAANVKFPLLTVAALQFGARAYPSLVPGAEIAKCKVQGADPQGLKRSRADRVGRHMSWQLMEQMEEWDGQMDRMVHAIPITGCAFKKVWFDESAGRPRSQMYLPIDIVADYNADPETIPPRLTQRFELFPHEITERERKGIYLPMERTEPAAAGQDEDAPHDYIEQHRLLDLDGDGYPEPYVVIIHMQAQKVVRITRRYSERDVLVNDAGEVAEIRGRNMWAKYMFLPPFTLDVDGEGDAAQIISGGWYGMGFGLLLYPINAAINTTINQLLDAATDQNRGGGFIGGGLKVKGGVLKFQRGEWKFIDSVAGGGNLAQNIVPRPTSQPSPVLFNLLGLLLEAGREIANIKDIQAEARSSNQPATTTLAVIEQGMKVYSSIFKRLYRGMKQELKILYRLNAETLAPQEYFTLHDTPEAIAQQDYAQGDLDVSPVADPSEVSDMHRMARAEAEMALISTGMVNPKVVIRDYLLAIGADNIDEKMQMPQQGPTPEQMVELAKLENDRKRLELDAARHGLELELKRERTIAEINKITADAIDKLASAEARESGVQMDQYRGQLEAIRARTEAQVKASEGNSGTGTSNRTAMGGMAADAGNPGISEPPPQPGPGGLGAIQGGSVDGGIGPGPGGPGGPVGSGEGEYPGGGV